MPVVPSSLAAVLSLLAPAFSAPTFAVFRALVVGFIGRVGEHTVCGIWQAARLAGRVHHSRGHDFFARARWCPDQLGLIVLDWLVERFVAPGAPLVLAVDASVFRRSGRRVHGASWHHDAGAAADGRAVRFGNCFVVLGLVVRIAALGERAWCLPVLFRLWLPSPQPARICPRRDRRPSQPELAAELIALVAGRFAQRRIDVVGDAAFACRAMAPPSQRVTLTCRLRASAVVHAPKPPPTGRRGRPAAKGARLGTVGEIIAAAAPGDWRPITVPGRGPARVLCRTGLWYRVLGPRPIRVLIVRQPGDRHGHRIALITTDTATETSALIARYADRWSIETCFHDAKHILGVGQARNRVPRAVERTVPFGLLCQTITIAWYALCGDPAADVQRRRRTAPWYPAKRAPAMLDILASLRRELIRTEYRAQARHPRAPRQNTNTQQPHQPAAA